MSLWIEETRKSGIGAADLVHTYPDSDFGPKIVFCPDCSDRADDVFRFLLQHYDRNAPDIIMFLWGRAVIRTALLCKESGTVLAFMAGVPFPVNIDRFSGTALLGTLVCVTPALRKTGLVRKYMHANMRLSALRGFEVRCSATTTPIALPHVCETRKYVLYPGDRSPGKRALKIAYDRARAVKILAEHGPAGIDWAANKWPADKLLRFYSAKNDSGGAVAAVVVFVNKASVQLIGGAATEPPLLRPLLEHIAWSLKRAVVIDATNPSDLHSDIVLAAGKKDDSRLVPDAVNPSYRVHFHNVCPASGEWAIPML